MTIKTIICDDSGLARKQIQKSLPVDWDLQITTAANGLECIQELQNGNGQLLFLDLNMPEMDRYQVLDAIREQDITSIVIVVSGDIQPEAQKRVMMSGALEFIKKPVDRNVLRSVLEEKNVYKTLTCAYEPELPDSIRDGYKEIANVAMGQAADLLARVLNAFVVMPIPNVNMLEVSELTMALNQVAGNGEVSAVCQGFIGSGIAGEALIIFNNSSITDIADLMNFQGNLSAQVEQELLMDIASILSGAYLHGIAAQLDMKFSQSHPVVLGKHIKMDELFKRSASRWKKTLTIETAITIEDRNINCHLLLLFTEDSISQFSKSIEILVEQ